MFAIPYVPTPIRVITSTVMRLSVVLSAVMSPLIISELAQEASMSTAGPMEVDMGASFSPAAVTAGTPIDGHALYRTLGGVTVDEDVMVSGQRGLFMSVPSDLLPDDHADFARNNLRLHDIINNDADVVDRDLAEALEYCASTPPEEQHAFRC